MDNDSRVFRRIAVGLLLVVILLGVILLSLDILDIDEYFRLNWSIPVINSVFISGISLVTLLFATRSFLTSASPVMLGLGGGVLAFGISVLLYAWFTAADLDTRIMLYDSGALFASAIHLAGAILCALKPDTVPVKRGSKITVLFCVYAGIVLVVGIIVWPGYQGTIVYTTKILTGFITSRDIVQGMAAVFCVISALVYLNRYHRQGNSVYFWYSLGLILLAAGFFFVLRGNLESRVAWAGRGALYLGGIYLLIAAWTGTGDTPKSGTD